MLSPPGLLPGQEKPGQHIVVRLLEVDPVVIRPGCAHDLVQFAEVLVDGSEVQLVRRRETYEDLIRGEA